jgi:excisionase family DNA binding protein
MQIDANEVYTFDEVCKILNLAPTTLRKLVKNGEIPATKLGKQYRFLGSELLRTLAESGQKGGRSAEESDRIREAQG